jgi:hypothetical protein
MSPAMELVMTMLPPERVNANEPKGLRNLSVV